MKKLLLAGSALLMMVGVAFGGAVNEKCPISGKKIGKATTEVKAPVCCKKCKKKVESDPGTHLSKLAASEEGKCIISGKDAKTEAVVTVGFCCGKCQKKFEADVKKHIAAVVVPAPEAEE